MLRPYRALPLLLLLGAMHAQAAEFRSSKPERRTEYWLQRQEAIAAELQDTQRLSQVRLVFLGDSITDFWQLDANPWVSGQTFGRQSWLESFNGTPAKNTAINLGISGDRTEHVLHRILPKAEGGLGELDPPELQPEFVVLMIGINNTWAWAEENPVVDSVLAGVTEVVEAVHRRKPGARIILQSLIPISEEAKNREVVLPINRRLEQLTKQAPYAGYTVFLDMYPTFANADGTQNTAHYVSDVLHPNLVGYRAWRDRLLPFLEEQRRARD